MKTHRLEEIIFFGVRCQVTLRPSLFPIGLLDELLIPFGPYFPGLIWFPTFVKAYWRALENWKEILARR